MDDVPGVESLQNRDASSLDVLRMLKACDRYYQEADTDVQVRPQ